MATDYLALMGRIATAPAAFAPGAALAQDAVAKVVAAAVVGVRDVATLRDIGVALGDDLEACMAKVTPAQAKAVVRKVDRHGTTSAPAEFKPRLLSLLRGEPTSPEPAPVTTIGDLGELRQLVEFAAGKGDAFDAWLASQPAPKRKAALKAYDAPREARFGSDAAAVVAHLKALAGGAPTVASLPVAGMTVEVLRTLRKDEPSMYEAWIASKAVKEGAPGIVAAMDPGHPNPGKLKSGPAVNRLKAIAEGGTPFPTTTVDTLDLPGLRALQAELGDTLPLWLKGMAQDRLLAAMRRLDPNRPKVDGLKSKECLFLLEKLAKGTDPVAAETEARVIGEHSFPVRS